MLFRSVAVKKQSASKVIEITCDELSLKTICTPNHKWKCVRDGEAVWVETSDLKVGDVIQAGGKYENYLDNGDTYRLKYYTNYFDFGSPTSMKILKKIIIAHPAQAQNHAQPPGVERVPLPASKRAGGNLKAA